MRVLRLRARSVSAMTLRELALRLRAAFWLVPAACAVGAGALALLLARVDRAFGDSPELGVLYGGGPDSARQMLGVIASSVLTFAGLTFSITIVALQLASSQFSPRVLRSMLRDRWTQAALGVFVGTFVFALLTLREVRGGALGTGFVPGLGVTVSLLLALASIAALMGFINHMAQSIRVVTVIDQITAETRRSVDHWYDATPRSKTTAAVTPHADGPRRIVDADRSGVLIWYDIDGLAGVAEQHDSTVELLVAPGTYVIAGQPLLRVTGAGEFDDGMLRSQLSFGSERETNMDPAYGFRQLVDIAERALSPGVNDPTTAIQCIDRLHQLLRRIATRNLAMGDRAVDGVLRLRVHDPSWADFVALACNEIRHWGAASPRVCHRLDGMLHDLRLVVDADRDDVLERQLELLTARRREALPDIEWQAALGPGDPAERVAARVNQDTST